MIQKSVIDRFEKEFVMAGGEETQVSLPWHEVPPKASAGDPLKVEWNGGQWKILEFDEDETDRMKARRRETGTVEKKKKTSAGLMEVR